MAALNTVKIIKMILSFSLLGINGNLLDVGDTMNSFANKTIKKNDSIIRYQLQPSRCWRVARACRMPGG